MNKKRLSTGFTILFLVAFAYYFVNNIESFKPLFGISVVSLAIILFTKTLRYIANGAFMQWTVEVFTPKFSLRESIYVAVLSAIGNFFGPLLGGTTIRAVYLKKVHKLSYSFFTSTLAGYYVILFAVGSFIGLASVVLLNRDTAHSSGLLFFFGLWFLTMIAMMFIRLPSRVHLAKLEKRKLSKFVIDVIYDIEKGWQQITSRKGLLLKLAFLGVSGYVLTYFTSYIEFRAVGAHISPAALGLYTAISATTILVSVTPGAIGVKEGLLILNSSVMGVTNDQILQVAVIDRSANFILLAAMYAMTKLIRNKETDRISEVTKSES